MEDGLICLYEESGRPELDAVFLNQIQQWHEENGVNTTLNRKLE